MKNSIIITIFFLAGKIAFAQQKTFYNDHKKGQFFILWGWNRAYYTRSTISFKGDDYQFKLYNVRAQDRPSLPITFHDYLQFNRLTIPQTNFRAGYFIKNNLAFTLGEDHMKYVMEKNQTVIMKGFINRDGPYKGTYDGDKGLTPDFLKFEHTNGLNYINAEAEKYFLWYHSKNNICIISGMLGTGAGVLFPRTDVTFLNYERNDRFHVSGFGLSAKAGVQLTLFKYFVIKIEDKYGYINMPDIVLHKKGIPGRSKQAFVFTQMNVMVGGTFPLNKTRKHN